MPRVHASEDGALAQKINRQFRGSVGRLLGNRRCFRVTGRERRAYLRALQEAFAGHYLQAQKFRRLCLEQDFFPWNLKRLEQLAQFPYLREEDSSHPVSLDIGRLSRQSQHIFGELKLRSPVRTNYLSLESGPQSHSKILLGLTPWSYRAQASRSEDGSWDGVTLLKTLERFEASGRPFRLLGRPSDIEECLTEVLETRRGRAFRFGPKSFVLTVGGWLGLDSQKIDKRAFRERVSVRLGLPNAQVRDIYWPVGHNLPYVECEAKRYHIPSYTQVIVRDTQTLTALPPGQKGRLQFLSPSSASWEGLSRLTLARGVILSQCRCGRRGSVLKLFGEICEA